MTLDDEWNSERRKEIRRAFMVGEVPDTCKSCIKRQTMNDSTLPSWIAEVIDADQHLQAVLPDGTMPVLPAYLHLSPSNKCNLACRMCCGNNSSMYAKHVDGIDLVIDHGDENYLAYIKRHSLVCSIMCFMVATRSTIRRS